MPRAVESLPQLVNVGFPKSTLMLVLCSLNGIRSKKWVMHGEAITADLVTDLAFGKALSSSRGHWFGPVGPGRPGPF